MRERFDWLDRWVLDPSDVIRTPGTESNVKEIYDKCAELSEDPANVIFNQFSEFGNHLVHYLCTGSALERVFDSLRASNPALKLRAFTSATGSAGTIAAGDYLKERLGSLVVAVEALVPMPEGARELGEEQFPGSLQPNAPPAHRDYIATQVFGYSTEV